MRMAPPTTSRRLLTTSLLIMMLMTSLARANSCANETDREAVSINQKIQNFTSSGHATHLNDTTETRVLDVLEHMETRHDDLTAALASLRIQQGELTAALVSLQAQQGGLTAALARLQTQQGELTAALVSLQTQQGELTAALVSLQSKLEHLASAEPRLSATTETPVLDVERIETREDELAVTLARRNQRDCSDVLAAGHSRSGVYLIQPTNASEAFRVYCDMTTDGGGWTVFQRRQSGNVDFFRDWHTYKQGFGDIEDEFWIGNDVLHLLTNDRAMQLRVDMSSFDINQTAYAEYASFSVSDESDYYRLEVADYQYDQGTAGDSLGSYHNRRPFTTRDQNNDPNYRGGNCAIDRHGAWWYNGCGSSNLNGRYFVDGDTTQGSDGIMWPSWKGWYVSLKETEMKVRPL